MIGIVVVDIAGRIHIPRIVRTILVRGTSYYGSYPILNTQSVNTILSFFNFPLASGYQLHRLFSSTHASSTFYRSYLVFMKTSFTCLAPSGSAPARRPSFDKFFLPFLSYQSSATQITDMVNHSYLFLARYLVQLLNEGLAQPQSHNRQRRRGS